MLLPLLLTLVAAAAPERAAAAKPHKNHLSGAQGAPARPPAATHDKLHVSDAEVARLAESFATTLEGESLLAFEPLAVDGVDGLPWLSVREVLERFRCLDVRAVAIHGRTDTAAATEVELELFATAQRMTAPVEALPPARWVLTIVPSAEGPRIAAAATAERRFAQRLVATASADERESLLRHAFALGSRELHNEIAEEVSDVLIYGGRNDPELRSRAFAVTESMVELAVAENDPAVEALALRALATLRRIHRSGSRLPPAVAAEAAAVRSGECDLIAAARFTLGSAMAEEGNAGGYVLVKQAAAMADSLEDPRVALRALHNAAVFETSAWNVTIAATLSAELAEKAGRARYLRAEGNGLSDVAFFHLTVGDFENAERYYIRAHSRYLAAGDRDFAASSLLNVALTHVARRDYAAALALVERGAKLARAQSIRSAIVADHANILIRLGRLEEAKCLLDTIAPDPLQARAGEPYYAAHAAIALAGGRAEEALTFSDLATAASRHDAGWRARQLSARILRRLGRNDEARLTLEEAVQFVELQRRGVPRVEWLRTRFFDERASPYYDYADLLAELGEASRALAVAERARARTLLDAMQSRRERLPMSAEERAASDRIETRIIELNREVVVRRMNGHPTDDVKEQLGRLQQELERVQTEAAFRARRNDAAGEQISARSDRLTVPRDTAVVEFLLGPERTTIFLVVSGARGAEVRTRQVATAEIEARVAHLLRAVRGRGSDEKRAAAAVYELLLAPFETIARTRASLYVVPDGVLWQVPFHALRDARGTLLAERWDIAYAQSITALAMAAPKRRAIDEQARLAAFGNPRIAGDTARRARAEFRDFPLSPLPEAADEVRAIAGMYRRARVFVGESAREDELKRSSGQCDILHIATHGMVDDQRPMHSALVFAPSAHEDGLLEARELLQLDIDARLAILSACDTARGANSAGEGVVSLSWALQVAGCPTTVVSLWKADSHAASALMIAFHRALLRGASVPSALRTAQQELRRDRRFAHPFYWAPFVVIGAP